ncbi:MAG: acyl carrier protein [Alphaproteobacteria bacterium]|nr:acyl carrier protein [Alphaproteobacteria bacterium]
MNEHDIKKEVLMILRESLYVDREIEAQDRLCYELGMDSLDFIIVSMKIEKEMDVIIEANDITKETTVGEFMEIVKSRAEQKKTPD